MYSKMAKGGGIKQSKPQETDSTYSKAIDKQVAGKPVGWRFTDKLAKKLGKKAGTKPSLAEIEKYKNRGVYFETRKNKSDINPKAKLEGGGENEYAKGGQTAPQRESYSKRGDKEVKAKPVGYRFTEKLANRLGKNVFTKPTQEQIEKYRGKGVYFENRKDKSDINPRAMFELGGENPDEKLKVKIYVDVYENDYNEGEGDHVNSYRVDWLKDDIVEAEYLVGYLANNLYLSRNPNDYYVFDDGRIDTDQLQDADGNMASENEIKMWKDGKLKLYNAHYMIKVEAVSNSRTPSVEELVKVTNIGAYAKGGQTAPQRESYSKRGDKEVKAKPVGYRFTEKLANRLGKNVFTKPTQEQVEKYRGKGVYFENRKDKSDINPRAMFEGGGDMEYAKGGQTAPQRESYSKRGDAEVKAKPVGYRFTNALAKRLGKSVSTKPTAEQVRKYLGKGVYFENRKDKSDIKPASYLAKGGQTAPQETDSTYSKSIDKQVSGKPVGYRFTNKLANKLGKKQYTKPTSAEIEKYSGKGVYFETRKNKSDLNPKAKLEGGGESEYARGGGVPRTSNADSKAYTENHLPFMANNLEGKTLENGDYVVLSYGYYPIWFWHKRTNKWYGNKDKFSVTTAKHISQSRPTYEAEMLSRGEMDNIMSKSIEGKDFKEMGGALDSFVVAQQ